MNARSFRRPESLREEGITRALIPPFLRSRGIAVIEDKPDRNGQTIVATLPNGSSVSMRVKLCWRRGADGRNQDRHTSCSAVQLIARVTDGDFVGGIERRMRSEAAHGTTHLLLVQRDGDAISLAALVPLQDVAGIWVEQRNVSDALIRSGALGRRKKNHAANGHSPTLWLQDDRGGQPVAEVLWRHPRVVDLLGEISVDEAFTFPEEVPQPGLYEEGAVRKVTVNAYERGTRARRACIARHGTDCAVCGFSFGAVYGDEADGHIHVHHLHPISLAGGSRMVDPEADLRPVCANCHSVIHLNGKCRSIDEVRLMMRAAAARRRDRC